MWVFLFNFERMETAKVIRGFTCKNKQVRFNIGDTYEGDATRIDELAKKGYVKALPKAHIPKMEVEPPTKIEVPKPKKKAK